MIDFRRALPRTSERVEKHTREQINKQIREHARQKIAEIASHPADIEKRLKELDREWDIERTLEANAAMVGLAGLILGMTANKRFFAIPITVGAFLLQHAVSGWCPPIPLFRRMGFRTLREIDNERFALKAIRGDFSHTPGFGQASPEQTASDALKATQ